MSRGLPTDEQLDRIRITVLARIARRRQVRQRVVGAVVAVALVGGGLGVAVQVVHGTGGALTSGSAGGGSGRAPDSLPTSSSSSLHDSSGGGSGSTADQSRSQIVVLCHQTDDVDSPANGARADPKGLPESALAACPTVDFQVGSGSAPTPTDRSLDSDSPQAERRGAAVCRDDKGGIQVFPSSDDPARVCARNGLAVVVRP